MRTIYKYELTITDRQRINMPEGAKILSVGVQGTSLCLWAEVESDGFPISRNIAIIGTGNPIHKSFNGKYIGSAIGHMGRFVWHVYEEPLS